jgi:HSP20 family molecular chaperone IbpA
MFVKTRRIVFPIELPGRSEKDIDILMYGNLLTIRAERKLAIQQQEAMIRWSELIWARLQRLL